MPKIPLVDVKAQYAALIPELQQAFADVLEDGRFVFGPNVYLMEGWQMVSEIHCEDGSGDAAARFTPEELIARKDELFAGRRSKAPQMGFGK